jgi:hypothetical protein
MLIAESADLILHFKQICKASFPTATFHDTVDREGFMLEFFGGLPNRIWIENAGSNLEAIGWEGPESTFIRSYFPAAHHIYSISYHSIDTAKKVITQLANSTQVLIDNDCGTLMLGQDFVHKVLAEPNWYWFDDLN